VMRELIAVLILTGLYFPLTVGVNRLQVTVFPYKKILPAQGTFLVSGVLGLLVCLLAGLIVIGGSLSEKLLWSVYLAAILGCALLVFMSIMCVSESGRRFFLMDLIDKRSGLTLEALKASYGRQHMLAVRLERLCIWNVVHKRGDRYFLVRRTAYLASVFFLLWGRLLGFHWL